MSCDDCHDEGWRTDCVFCHGGVDDTTGAPPEDIRDEADAYRTAAILDSRTLQPGDAFIAWPGHAVDGRRFVTAAEKVDYVSPWTLEEWLSRADVVPNKELLMVRANMEPGRSHPFHSHPTRAELIYIISGTAEQWVGQQKKILRAGDMAFIPMGEVHGTWNAGDEKLVFLAILSPSNAAEPGIVDRGFISNA